MSVLVDVDDLPLRNDNTYRPPAQAHVDQSIDSYMGTTSGTNASGRNQYEEMDVTPMNRVTTVKSRAKRWTSCQRRGFLIGLILGALVAATALAVLIVLWQTSELSTTTTSTTTTSSTSTTTTATTTTTSVTTTTTSVTTTTTSVTTTTTSVTTTTTSVTTTTTSVTTTTTSVTTTTTSVTTTTTSVTTTTTSVTTTTTSATTTTTSVTTTTTTTTETTTTVPPSTLCVSSFSVSLQNNEFIYSPTSQTYAAGMLNNQFGIFNAYSYLNVTSSALWTASQSSTSIPCYLALQADRNLVIYETGAPSVFWAASVQNSGIGVPFCLQMLDSGNLIWTDNTATIVWQTYTAQPG